MGLDNLLEMILLVADTMELTANPNRMAKGTVIEAKLDTGRGPVATVLIQNWYPAFRRSHYRRHRRGPCACHDQR